MVAKYHWLALKWELKYPTLSQCYGRNRQPAALRSHGASWPHSRAHSSARGLRWSAWPPWAQFPQRKAGWTGVLCENTWGSFKGSRESLRAPGNCPPSPRTPSQKTPGHPQRHVTQRLAYTILTLERLLSGRPRTPPHRRKCGCGAALPAGSRWIISFPLPHPHDMSGENIWNTCFSRGKNTKP